MPKIPHNIARVLPVKAMVEKVDNTHPEEEQSTRHSLSLPEQTLLLPLHEIEVYRLDDNVLSTHHILLQSFLTTIFCEKKTTSISTIILTNG